LSLNSTFKRIVRDASLVVADEGWVTRGGGIIRHHDNGYWAQVVFFGASRKHDPLELGLIAGVCSPYLLRVVNKQDPTKPPAASFTAAHASVVWNMLMTFSETESEFAEPLEIPEVPGERPLERLTLGPNTAPSWIEDAFLKLTPRVDSLCSDEALRDHILDGPNGSFSLRYAALLTRRLGEEERLEQVLAMAEAAAHREEERAIREIGHPVGGAMRDRQETYPQDWSHERFLRFMAETPTE
jgi:hypothetical protein